jgi:hypothetical protein
MLLRFSARASSIPSNRESLHNRVPSAAPLFGTQSARASKAQPAQACQAHESDLRRYEWRCDGVTRRSKLVRGDAGDPAADKGLALRPASRRDLSAPARPRSRRVHTSAALHGRVCAMQKRFAPSRIPRTRNVRRSLVSDVDLGTEVDRSTGQRIGVPSDGPSETSEPSSNPTNSIAKCADRAGRDWRGDPSYATE